MKLVTLKFLLATLVVLPGCATFKSPFDTTSSVDSFLAKPPRNGKGLVLLLVTPNSGKVNWQEAALNVRRINRAGNYSGGVIPLVRVPLSTSSETAAYVGKLFPGRYSVTSLSHTRLVSDFQAATDVVAISEEGDANSLIFVVESSKLTDAGRLLVNSDGDEWVGAWSSDRKAADDVDRGNMKVAEYLSGFEKAAKVKQLDSHRKRQNGATRKPNGAFDLKRHRKQGVVAGSRMASVLRRGSDGKWQRSRVGRYQRVLAVNEFDDGRLLFAGEDNLLGYQFGKSPNNKFRYIKTPDIPNGQFTAVYWSAERGLLALHENGERVRLFQSDAYKKPKWTVVADVAQSDDVPANVKTAHLQVERDYVAVAVYPNTIVTSESAGSDWVTATATDDISDFRLRSGGVLQMLTINRYIASVAARDSTSGGAGWRKLDIAPRTKRLALPADGEEYTTRVDVVDDDRSIVKLLHRPDPDTRWSVRGRMPAGKLYAVSHKHLFVVGSGFDEIKSDGSERASTGRDFVAYSDDGGKSWEKELER